MNQSSFDRLTRAAAALRSRRALAQSLAALPLISTGSVVLSHDTAAKPKHHRQREDAHAEKKHKKKTTLCLNGQTIKASKKNKKKLLKQGATPGACAAQCVPGVWAYKSTFSEFGTGPDNVRNPAGIAVTPDGLTAWVSDNDLDRITVWTRASASSATWTHKSTFGTTGSGASNLDQPAGIAVAPGGLTVWIADAWNLRVSVWTRPTASSTVWTNQTTFGGNISIFNYPYDVAVTPDGLTVAVADSQHDRVSIWTRSTASSTDWTNHSNFGSPGSGPTNFHTPQYVALSADGLTVLASDVSNYRVSVWSRPNATSTAWAHQSNFGTPGSGMGQFNSPTDVAITSNVLTAYVGDFLNSRVSVWTRPNASSTAWTSTLNFAVAESPSSNLGPPYALTSSSDGKAVWVAAATSPIRVWSTTCPI